MPSTTSSAAVDRREPAGAGQAAIDVAGAGLDLQLRSRPYAEVDLARLDLWSRQLTVDAAANGAGAVAGDVATIETIRDRIADTLGSSLERDRRRGPRAARRRRQERARCRERGGCATSHRAGPAQLKPSRPCVVRHSRGWRQKIAEQSPEHDRGSHDHHPSGDTERPGDRCARETRDVRGSDQEPGVAYSHEECDPAEEAGNQRCEPTGDRRRPRHRGRFEVREPHRVAERVVDPRAIEYRVTARASSARSCASSSAITRSSYSVSAMRFPFCGAAPTVSRTLQRKATVSDVLRRHA